MKPTDETLNQFVADMLGVCRHEPSGMLWICGKCKTDAGAIGPSYESYVDVRTLNPNYLTDENHRSVILDKIDEMGLYEKVLYQLREDIGIFYSGNTLGSMIMNEEISMVEYEGVILRATIREIITSWHAVVNEGG
jgi:hypothetical protein